MTWQPIETAPKSGRTDDDQIGVCAAVQWGSRWSFHHAWFDDMVEEWTDISSDRYIKPTRWMPLPELPND